MLVPCICHLDVLLDNNNEKIWHSQITDMAKHVLQPLCHLSAFISSFVGLHHPLCCSSHLWVLSASQCVLLQSPSDPVLENRGDSEMTRLVCTDPQLHSQLLTGRFWLTYL